MNFAPAKLPEEGERFDLPIALGQLAASGRSTRAGWKALNAPVNCRWAASCSQRAAR